MEIICAIQGLGQGRHLYRPCPSYQLLTSPVQACGLKDLILPAAQVAALGLHEAIVSAILTLIPNDYLPRERGYSSPSTQVPRLDSNYLERGVVSNYMYRFWPFGVAGELSLVC